MYVQVCTRSGIVIRNSILASMSHVPCASAIRILMYVQVYTKLDIAFIMNVFSCSLDCNQESHEIFTKNKKSKTFINKTI